MQTQSIEISLKTIWYTVLIALSVWFLFVIRDVLLLLLVAIIVASAIQPLVDGLENGRWKIPRFITTPLIYLIFLTGFFWFIKISVPVLSTEIKELGIVLGNYLGNLGNLLANYMEVFSDWQLVGKLDTLKNSTSTEVARLGANIFSNTLEIFNGLWQGMIVIVLSFYMVIKKDGAWGFLNSIVPKKYEKYAIGLIKRIQRQVGRWMIGQFVLAIIIFVLEYAVLSMLGVPLALTLALLGGLLEVVPYIGPTVSVIPAVLISLTISPWLAFFVLIAYIVIQQIENNIIIPLLMKKAVGLNPVVVIIVLLIGGKLAGVAGLILAVPLAAAGSVVWGDIVNEEYLSS